MKLPTKKRLTIYWSAAALFAVAMMTCAYFFFALMSPRLLTARANRLFHQSESVATATLQALSEKENLHDEIEKSNTVYLCYHRDSLVYWSNNREPVPFLLSTFDDLNQPLVELKNGTFYPIVLDEGDSIFVALIPIYYHYPIENVYYDNRFAGFFRLPMGSLMSCVEDSYGVRSEDGTFLFSIVFPPKMVFKGWNYRIVFALFLLFYLSVIFCIYQTYLVCSQHVRRKKLLLYGFIFLALAFTTSILLFRLPEVIFNHPFFSPHYFAYNRLFSSSGQTFLISIALALACYAIYQAASLQRNGSWMPVVYPVVSGLLFYFLFLANNALIMNASIFIDLSFLFKINIYSILHLFSVLCCSLAVLFLNLIWVKMLLLPTLKRLALLCGWGALVTVALAFVCGFSAVIALLCLLWMVIPVVLLFYSNKIAFRYLMLNVLFFSLISSALLEHFSNKFEQKQRYFLAERFSEQGREEDREYFFKNLSDKILHDQNVQGYLRNFNDTLPVEYDQVICNYIISEYLNKNWHDYNAEINICTSGDILHVGQPENEQSCFDYFYEKIEEAGEPTLSPNLYFFANDYYSFNYIGVIQPPLPEEEETHVPVFFILLYPLQHYSEADYPDFLSKQYPLNVIDAARYSYAIYDSTGLVYSFGDANYSIALRPLDEWTPESAYRFYKSKHWDNLRFRMSDGKTLIISKNHKTFIQVVSPFTYLLVAYLLLFYGICIFFDTGININTRLRDKLQQAILIVLSGAFVVVGITALLFVNMLNERKNEENLNEKTKSFINILYNSDRNLPYLLEFDRKSMTQLLRELSTIFFSEINLYTPDGNLYATSNPFVFENGFTSSLLDYRVWSAIINKQEHFITQKESIGNSTYFSSYSSIYDESDNPVAVLNVAHFSSSGQHEHDLEAFISTFINLYIFVFLLFLSILLYLSNQITRPIRLLTKYFGKIRIGGKNEKILWSRGDEFARMIVEYNRMIDELEISAQRLAASEREGGWRDMAKQVAHEIKNPLTPMRLTVQHLQRTWNEQSAHTPEQIERFCQTIIQQIDTLSDIANEFSYFAKTPTPHFEFVELKKILSAAIDIYENSAINFHIFGFDDLYVNADQHLILRVFNNLIKNAVESLGGQKNGLITIAAAKRDDILIISIQDNGHGISQEMLQRIFVPTFTTRSSGMGLGLSMVKTIVEEHNGTISVVSEEGKGTIFTMKFKI